MLVTTNESKELIKWYEKVWSKIRDLISSKTKNSDNYDEKYIKILFILDDKLPLNKTIEVQSMIIAVRTVFHDNNKYYPQFFLDECLYKLWIMNNIKMFYYDQTDVSEGINVKKTSGSKECNICHLLVFFKQMV